MSSERTSRNPQKAHLPRLHENPYENVIDADWPNAGETGKSNEKPKKALRAAAAVLVAAGAVITADSKIATKTINSIIDSEQNAMAMPSVPKPENATAVIIGDTIEFKAADGKTQKVKIETLSDITAAAQTVNPDINASSYDAMLESENNNSAQVHFGDKFTVDKTLGITDLGPSAG